MASPLILDSLSKFYGQERGIEGVSLELNSNEVFGFLGPNGAGKTTAIRLILDFLRPTSGSASVFGLDSAGDSLEIKERIGYLAGDIALYGDMTGQQVLRYMTALGRKTDWEYVSELTELLEAQLDKPIASLSKGNKQKIGLLQAFMHRPELLVLDEPTSGLDPLMQQVFYKMVEDARDNGASVFISSHNLHEVQRLCDRAAFIRKGRIVAIEDIASTTALSLRRYNVVFAKKPKLEDFKQLASVSEVSVDELDNKTLHITISGTPNELLSALSAVEVVDLSEDETTLEDVFMHYYEEEGSDV